MNPISESIDPREYDTWQLECTARALGIPDAIRTIANLAANPIAANLLRLAADLESTSKVAA